MTKPTMPEMIAASWRRERPDLDQRGLGLALRIRALSMVIDYETSIIAAREGMQLDDVLLLLAMRRVGKPYQLRPTDIGAILNITSGGVTYRIDRMIKQGLCERVIDSTDRRSYMMQISPAGVEIIDRILNELDEVSNRALTAAKLDDLHISGLQIGLTMLESGWESIIPKESNPLFRGKVAKRKGKMPKAGNNLKN